MGQEQQQPPKTILPPGELTFVKMTCGRGLSGPSQTFVIRQVPSNNEWNVERRVEWSTPAPGDIAGLRELAQNESMDVKSVGQP